MTYKYRVVEKKLSGERSMFIPQYKNCVFWKDLSNHDFTKSKYNHDKRLLKHNYVLCSSDAFFIIKHFKMYIRSKNKYKLILNESY